MGLVAPAALGLSLLALPIIALYLIRIQRPEQVVPSTLLWNRVARDIEANQPWQRFRPNWLLLLQLLALLALVAALARPFLRADAALGAVTVVVIDTSASMGARDSDPTRLDGAKAAARDLVARMPAGGEMLIVVAGAQARVVQPMTADELRQAIDGVAQEHGQAAMADALALATSAAARLPDAGIVVFSDDDTTQADVASVPVPVRLISMATSAPVNLGITTMAAGQAGSRSEVFLRVWNTAATTAIARLTLFDDDTDALIAAQDLAIPPGTDAAFTVPEIPSDTTIVRAELTGMERDDLADDNRAWARTRTGERARVLLVTPGNLFLERALALLPDLDVSLGTSEGGAPHGFDLYVFDGVLPPDGLAAPLLLLDPPATSTFIDVTGAIEQPAITNIRTDDPILADVDLGQTHLAVARALTAPAWASTLVAAGDAPVLLSGLHNGARTAIIGFDLRASDLPLQTAFPILVANLTGWLLPETTATAPASISPGTVVALTPRTGADVLEIVRSDGTTARVPAAAEVLWSGTGLPGSYRVRDLDGDTVLRSGGFVVNLLDVAESDIVGSPGDAPSVVGASITAESDGVAVSASGSARRLLWWPTVAIGIAILAMEWWAYYRGRWRPRPARHLATLRMHLAGVPRRWRPGP